jgi:hypothetical protein
LALQKFFEGFGLGNGPGKTIEQEPAFAAEAPGTFGNERQHGCVRYQLAAAHIIKRSVQGGRALAAVLTLGGSEDVAGREMAGAKIFAEQFGLGAFANARGAEQNQPTRFSFEIGLRITDRCSAT